jgi:hypothetical protein
MSMNYKLTLNYLAKPKILVNVFEDTITHDSGITESGAIEMIQDKIMSRSNELECEFTKQHVINVVRVMLPRTNCKSKDDSLKINNTNVSITFADGEFQINAEIEFSSDDMYLTRNDDITYFFSEPLTSMLNRNDFYIDVTPITDLEYEFDFEIAIEVSESDVKSSVIIERVVD